MDKVRVEINYKNVGEFLHSKGMEEMVTKIAEGIAEVAGDGYGVDKVQMPERVIASVETKTWEAAQDNLQNNTLLKAVGA